MGQNRAPQRSMEAHNLYMATCWCRSLTRKHVEFGFHRDPSRAAIWIRLANSNRLTVFFIIRAYILMPLLMKVSRV